LWVQGSDCAMISHPFELGEGGEREVVKLLREKK